MSRCANSGCRAALVIAVGPPAEMPTTAATWSIPRCWHSSAVTSAKPPGVGALPVWSGVPLTRTYTRVLRPGLAELLGPDPPASSPLRSAFDKLLAAIDQQHRQAHLAA